MAPYTCDQVWEMIRQHQGEEFLTAKGLPFTYTMKGGELFVSRRSKSITKSTFEAAWSRVLERPAQITGPKKLNVFGAPYLWAVFKKLELVPFGARYSPGQETAAEGENRTGPAEERFLESSADGRLWESSEDGQIRMTLTDGQFSESLEGGQPQIALTDGQFPESQADGQIRMTLTDEPLPEASEEAWPAAPSEEPQAQQKSPETGKARQTPEERLTSS